MEVLDTMALNYQTQALDHVQQSLRMNGYIDLYDTNDFIHKINVDKGLVKKEYVFYIESNSITLNISHNYLDRILSQIRSKSEAIQRKIVEGGNLISLIILIKFRKILAQMENFFPQIAAKTVSIKDTELFELFMTNFIWGYSHIAIKQAVERYTYHS